MFFVGFFCAGVSGKSKKFRKYFECFSNQTMLPSVAFRLSQRSEMNCYDRAVRFWTSLCNTLGLSFLSPMFFARLRVKRGCPVAPIWQKCVSLFGCSLLFFDVLSTATSLVCSLEFPFFRKISGNQLNLKPRSFSLERRLMLLFW